MLRDRKLNIFSNTIKFATKLTEKIKTLQQKIERNYKKHFEF